MLIVGCIPGANDVYYGDIRNRTRKDGGQWLQPGLLSFFNTKLEESNELITPSQQEHYLRLNKIQSVLRIPRKIAWKVKRLLMRVMKP